MKKSTTRILSLACSATLALAFFLNSCTKEVGKPPVSTTPPPPPPPPGACDTITYTNHIKKLVDTRCVSCHNDALLAGTYSFDNYTTLKEVRDNGKLHNVIFVATGTKKMPQGSELSADEKALIQCWIDNGGKQ